MLIVAAAETSIGTYGIAKGLQDRFEVWIGKRQITGAYYTKAEALTAAQSDFETRIRSALVSGSREGWGMSCDGIREDREPGA